MDEPKLRLLENSPALEAENSLAPENSPAPEAEIPLTPEQEILSLIAKNIYTDAILQSIGLIVLGAAIRSRPSLNERKHYADELDPDEPDATGCDIQFLHVATVESGELLTYLDTLIGKIAAVLDPLLTVPDDKHRMVAGTLRIHVTLAQAVVGSPRDSMHFNLMWVEKQVKE